MKMLVDTHTHIEGEDFKEDFEALLNRAEEAGLGIIVNPAYDLVSSRAALALAQKYEQIYACVGYHPSDSHKYDEEGRRELLELAREAEVVAIGEIGLDYYYDKHDKETQKSVFIEQIEIARLSNLPVVIHSRSADQDTFDILQAEKAYELGVLMHCYSQSLEMAREYVKRGAYLGIGGVITFKNAKKLVEVVREIPLEHLVLETDAPYLAPEPYRGKRNEPSYITRVCEKIAEIKKVSYDEVAAVTSANALRFYGIER